MKVAPGNAQHIGSREEQQDSFAFSDIADRKFVAHGGVLAVLADGMGGLAGGRAASSLAVRTVLKEYEKKNSKESVRDALAGSVIKAHDAVREWAKGSAGEGEAGTTISAAVVHDGRLYWFSAGDSRIYLYREGELSQITIDHNYGLELDEMVARGDMSSEAAKSHPERNHLISYLGTPELNVIDSNQKPFPLRENDRILLCSDGLYGTLSEEEITEELDADPQDAAERLLKKALDKNKKHQDNITILIMGVDPSPRTVQKKRRVSLARVCASAGIVAAIGVCGFLIGRYTSFQIPAIPFIGKAAPQNTAAPSALKETPVAADSMSTLKPAPSASKTLGDEKTKKKQTQASDMTKTDSEKRKQP